MVFGYFISLISCKRAMLLLTIPSTVHWLLIYFGNHYFQILLAKFFDGIVTGGSASTIMLYISEIANDKYEILGKIDLREKLEYFFSSVSADGLEAFHLSFEISAF